MIAVSVGDVLPGPVTVPINVIDVIVPDIRVGVVLVDAAVISVRTISVVIIVGVIVGRSVNVEHVRMVLVRVRNVPVVVGVGNVRVGVTVNYVRVGILVERINVCVLVKNILVGIVVGDVVVPRVLLSLLIEPRPEAALGPIASGASRSDTARRPVNEPFHPVLVDVVKVVSLNPVTARQGIRLRLHLGPCKSPAATAGVYIVPRIANDAELPEGIGHE